MNTKSVHKSKGWLLGAILLLLAPLSVQADIYSLARKFTMDRLELEVQVNDVSGKPLPGAVVWYIASPIRAENGMSLSISDVQRMAQRYANQSDFLIASDVPGAVFERTNLKGQYQDYREIKEDSSKYPYIIVAAKRGYIAEVIEGAAPYNQHHLVQFRLKKPDPQAHVDARMEEFDRLMAQARSVEPGENIMDETRMLKLRVLEQKTRTLADDLVKDGLHDEASAVYWALADFPDVTLIATSDGRQKITGYRNGRTDEASEADRLHATQLNSTVTKLLINKMMVARGFPRVGINTEAHGKAYLDAFEQLEAGSLREHILPIEHEIAIYQAIRWSTPKQACNLLREAYLFEPAAMPLKDWWGRLKDVGRQSARLQLPPIVCEIKGLPPF